MLISKSRLENMYGKIPNNLQIDMQIFECLILQIVLANVCWMWLFGMTIESHLIYNVHKMPLHFSVTQAFNAIKLKHRVLILHSSPFKEYLLYVESVTTRSARVSETVTISNSTKQHVVKWLRLERIVRWKCFVFVHCYYLNIEVPSQIALNTRPWLWHSFIKRYRIDKKYTFRY